MQSEQQQVKDLLGQAELDRKRGDAFRKAGREEDSIRAFESGAKTLQDVLKFLDGVNWSQSTELAALRAETLGSLGGMLRRTGKNSEAFEQYKKGAKIEDEFELPETYNRVNELKYLLRTGQTTLKELEPKIRSTADSLEKGVTNPLSQKFSDNAWSWADLGDCLALLGDLDGADRAYATFIKKADLKSPTTTLDVLRGIADELRTNSDPDAGRVSDAVANLESRLKSPMGQAGS